MRNIQDRVPDLPGTVAQELLAIASPEELQDIARAKLSDRLENLARWALRDVRSARAYEGLHLKSVDNPDTRRLALHSLENLPGWNPDVRIDVHRFELGGALLDSFGKEDAADHDHNEPAAAAEVVTETNKNAQGYQENMPVKEFVGKGKTHLVQEQHTAYQQQEQARPYAAWSPSAISVVRCHLL